MSTSTDHQTGYEIVNYPPAVDLDGTETGIAVLLYDGQPVGVIRRSERSDNNHEHVVGGLSIRESKDKDGYSFGNRRHEAMPASGATPWDEEPTPEQMADRARAIEEWSDGSRWLRNAPKDSTVPEGRTDAWYEGVQAARERTGRVIRQGKVLGDPRTF